MFGILIGICFELQANIYSCINPDIPFSKDNKVLTKNESLEFESEEPPHARLEMREETSAVHSWMVSILSLWLPDEAKIETEQEEDEMDDGPSTADLWCFDKICSQQRHRNVGEIEIEQNAR
jgi:hypothetical protein